MKLHSRVDDEEDVALKQRQHDKGRCNVADNKHMHLKKGIEEKKKEKLRANNQTAAARQTQPTLQRNEKMLA